MTTSDTGAAVRTKTTKRGALHGAVLVAGGLAVAQVFSYLLSLISAKVLGPDGYGVMGAMLNLILVGNVLALGIQAAGARRIVLMDATNRPRVGAGVLRAALVAGILVFVVTALLSPIFTSLLHLSSFMLILLVAANLYPATVYGGLLGVSQGREAHARFAIVCALTGSGRAVGGIAGVLAGKSVTMALTGMLAGSIAGVLIAWLLTKPLVAKPPMRLENFRSDVLHATHALFALFVLTNMDVLLARHFLTPTQAGMYAAGSIVAKVTFWLPQVVAMVAYPRLADHRRSSTLGLAALAVIAIGLVATGMIALLKNVVVQFVGGSAYAGLASEVWVFAAAGSAFGLAQFLLYSQIAASKRAAIVVLWLAVASLVVVVWRFHSSVLQIASCVLCVALAVSLVGMIELLIERQREPERAERKQKAPTGAAGVS